MIPDRHDQSTYWGRLCHFAGLIDPRTLLTTDKQLEDAKNNVAFHSQDNFHDLSIQTIENLWYSKKIIQSTLHPDTGEKIFLPFRMASFVPTNILIVAGILFWQVLNQSANVAFNYCNSNKSSRMTRNEMILAYSVAVASSCTIALGMKRVVDRFDAGFLLKSVLQKSVPFTAVAMAGTINVVLMRQKELTDGIKVHDEKGNTLGFSGIAGFKAISQVAISRIATSFPVVFVPGLIMSQLMALNWVKSCPRVVMPLNLLCITCSLMIGLPLAIAIFPQKASIHADLLEVAFHNLVDADGLPIKKLYFNRGL